jgi:hypothetical protein
MKNFSNFFKRRNLYYKDILYKENEIIDNNHVIYFVKNGEFGTKAKKSLQEIDNIILKSSLKRNIDKNEIDRLEIYKDYSIKRDIKFESFGENDILGLGDCGVGNRYIYTLFCNSNEATVFEIHITFFKMLLNLDKKILIKAEEIEKIKCDIILRLLYRQRESWLNFIESKLKYKLWLWGHYHATRVYPPWNHSDRVMLFNDKVLNIDECFKNNNPYDYLVDINLTK